MLSPPSTSMPPILRLPSSVLEEIGLAVAVDDTPGLPGGLVPLLQSCKHVYSELSFRHNNYLYAHMFRNMFDTLAVRRRFGDDALHSKNLATQLRTYCLALRRIRAHDFEAPAEALWAAFFMLMENDGRNYAQLEKAGLRSFVDGFVHQRLWANCEETHGWPAESIVNALALCLMWHTTDYEMLQRESPEVRQEFMKLIRPFVVNPVRYAPFHTPDNHFILPVPRDFQHPYTHRTPQGLYPPYRNTDAMMTEHEHFGQPLCILQPSVSLYAKLVYFARIEAMGFPIPTDGPEDRASAIEQGLLEPTPTREDYKIFNEHKGAALVPRQPWDWFEKLNEEDRRREDDATWSPSLTALSAQQDLDWNRMCFCYNPRMDPKEKGVVYTPGSITGQWMGRLLMPDYQEYFDMVQSISFVSNRPRMSALPISFRLREHHCINPSEPISHGGESQRPMFDDGISNAWFPKDIHRFETKDKCVVKTHSGRQYLYQTFKKGQANSHDENRCTVCIARREIESEELSRRMAYLDTDTPEFASGSEVADTRSTVEEALGGGVSVDEVLVDEMYRENELEDTPLPPCNGICDIIVTGESIPKHGQAWHHYTFYGRVRRWDGLIALVRTPVNRADLGVCIFRGYIVGNQNFVGTWRAWTSVGVLPLEGPFTASRAPDAE